jgi:broad specificity polyphosphatase/5'/3'-nucleotidase SurE
MLNTRYWWLEGAPTDAIRRGIDEVFSKHDVETIAPGYGCILSGRKVVARHVRMLDGILKGLDKSVAVSRYVSRDEER